MDVPQGASHFSEMKLGSSEHNKLELTVNLLQLSDLHVDLLSFCAGEGLHLEVSVIALGSQT